MGYVENRLKCQLKIGKSRVLTKYVPEKPHSMKLFIEITLKEMRNMKYSYFMTYYYYNFGGRN